jgi:hypothetical protein
MGGMLLAMVTLKQRSFAHYQRQVRVVTAQLDTSKGKKAEVERPSLSKLSDELYLH